MGPVAARLIWLALRGAGKLLDSTESSNNYEPYVDKRTPEQIAAANKANDEAECWGDWVRQYPDRPLYKAFLKILFSISLAVFMVFMFYLFYSAATHR